MRVTSQSHVYAATALTVNVTDCYTRARMTFAEQLRAWRKKLYQKEAADILQVNIRSYQAWEEGRREPTELAKIEVYRRMEKAKQRA